MAEESHIDKSYYVRFEAAGIDDLLTATFHSMEFTQTTGNAVSHAEMVFKIKSLSGSRYNPDEIPKSLMTDRIIKFQVFDRNGIPQTKKHIHTYVPHSANFLGVNGGYMVSIVTEEWKKSDMRIVAKSRAHKADKISSIVRDIMQENGFKNITVEETVPIPEFEILRQPWMHDYDFVVKECGPRALSGGGGAGYRLFTSDGETGFWTTLGYGAQEKVVKKNQLVEAIPSRNHLFVVDSGSANLLFSGFDMDKKKPQEFLKDESVSPTYGSQGLFDRWAEGLKVKAVPYTSPEGVEATATASLYPERYAAFPITVKVRGSSGWDEVPYNVKVPFYHEKGGGTATAYANTVIHRIFSGEYFIEILGLRDKVDVL